MGTTDISPFIQNYAMGLAYKQITQNMGPSAQLIAFVNYDRSVDNDTGLESLDIAASHAQILAEIDNDPSLGLACESLVGRIKSIAEKFKNSVTFNRHDNLSDLVSETLTRKKSNIYVPAYRHVNTAIGYAQTALASIAWLLPKIPTGHDAATWTKFYDAHIKNGGSGDVGEKHRQIIKMKKLYYDIGKKDEFEKSGWTADNIKQTIRALGKLQDDHTALRARVIDVCSDLQDMLELVNSSLAAKKLDDRSRVGDMVDSAINHTRSKDDPYKKPSVVDMLEKAEREAGRQQRAKQHDLITKAVPAHVYTAMDEVSNLVEDAAFFATNIERWVYKSVVDVSRHFEIVN